MTKLDVSRATNLIDLPGAEDLPGRIRWLEARYLKNARDDEFQECLGEILQVGADGALLPAAVRDPLNGETRGMQVIGASGDGKSVMIQRNLTALPGFAEMKDGTSGNYIHITVSPEATIKSLASDILGATGYGRLAERAKVHEAWAVVRHRLKMLDVAMLWIDEGHHLLRGGAGRDVAGALQPLKNLLQGEGGGCGHPLGCAAARGTYCHRPRDLSALSPASAPSVCHRWRHGTDMQRLHRFIVSCCRKLELLPPEDPSFAERIVFSQKAGLGRSIAFSKMTLRRALINRQAVVSFEDARRVWILNGGSDSEPTPFDPGSWPDLRKLLEARGW